ncbi:MAG: HAMP domain-containing sensor histidine kinase [Chloroflexota bacterium]
MFFKTLRGRLFGALGLVVVLTIGLSSMLTIYTTTLQFEQLTQEEALGRAKELAPLIEASYWLVGDWERIEEPFFAGPMDDEAFFGVDWFEVVADELGVDSDLLLEELAALGSLTAVSEAYNTPPSQLANAIYVVEEEFVKTAVSDGYLSAMDADFILANLPVEIDFFLNDSFVEAKEWDETLAAELGVSSGEVSLARINGRSPRTLAVEKNIFPDSLTQAIVIAEAGELADETALTSEKIWYLSNTIVTAREYVNKEPWLTEDVFADDHLFDGDALADSLFFSEDQLLVADETGLIVYDSYGQAVGAPLDSTLAEHSVPLWDFNKNQPLGHLAIATGRNFFDVEELAFLQGITQSALISSVVAGLGALLVGLFIAQRITRPVTALTQAAQNLASGQQVERLPVHSQDELGQMSETFNEMADAIETQQQLRSRLIDDISHELNTPLTLIQLELEGLKDGMQSPEQTAVQVQREIELLHNLVNDLTLVANLEGNGVALSKARLDWTELVQTAVLRWQPQAETKNINLRVVVQDNFPQITADSRRLNQVLGNLIGNALQHTPNSGSVTVATRHEQGKVITTIQDSGVGIPATDLPHIFDRFYRTDPSRNRRSGGRGLGLAIVRQIVEQHGGRVWAESEQGVGSRFGFELPA